MARKKKNKLDGLVTVDQAAAQLGISPSMVRRYIREERIADVINIGNVYLLPQQSVDAFDAIPREVGNPDWRHDAD